jgi:hypothetical protein
MSAATFEPTHKDAVLIPSIDAIDWGPTGLEGQGGVPGPTIKQLSAGTGGFLTPDPKRRMATWLCHQPPGWADPEIVYHPCAEEGFILDGEVWLANRALGAGTYVYRPPGILHGPAREATRQGTTLILRYTLDGGMLRHDASDGPSFDLQPITDEHENWPMTWTERADTNLIPWVAVTEGPWTGVGCKWLNRNRVTGGGTVLLELPPGWHGVGSAARGLVEEFLVDGQLTAAGLWFSQWGYACRPAGKPAGEYAAPSGARLLCFWDEDEIAAAPA